MKALMTVIGFRGWLAGLAAAGLSLANLSLSGATTGGGNGVLERPAISRLRLHGTNLTVIAQVPAGLKKVVLETRPQIGRGAWEPRKVVRLDGNGGAVSFQISESSQMVLVRVRADDQEPLPAFFYRGTNVFANATGEGTPTATDITAFYDGTGGAVPGTTSTSGGTAKRDVVESDIWKLDGNRLYFFNQYRGLQVIDVSTLDAPVVLGTLSLPGVGDQMYLLDSNHVVLLAHDYCAGTSQAMVVEVNNGVPAVKSVLAIPGNLLESRLVGTALYTACQVSRSSPDGTSWESGTLISAFDLATPEQPIARNTLWLNGWEQAVAATDHYFFVAVQDPSFYWQSLVQTVDISDPSGWMVLGASIRPSGQVKDKFKMNLDGSVFSVVSEENRWESFSQILVTRLETFALSEKSATKLGEVELVRGEQVYASRFAGNRAYVVTFRRIDPLWVVDLSDPYHPRIAGELQIPGWSSYIEPVGDQLVTVGFDNTNGWSRVAVQLFDVSDPAKPALLSKVPLGEGYSWSEANLDEKAFSVLPEAGLILIPYQGQSTNGQVQRVQLIDLGRDSLTARGVIEHQITPRRATVRGDRILSLSGWELLSVDAADRDHPLVRRSLELAWPVDRLFLSGEYLLEVTLGDAGWSWWSPSSLAPQLRVASASEPDRVLRQLPLPSSWPIAGASVRKGKLFVAQVTNEAYYYVAPIPLKDGSANTDPGLTDPAPDQRKPNLLLTVIDLSSLPEVQIEAQTDAVVERFGYGVTLEAVWPRDDLLVWCGGGSSWPWFYRPVWLSGGAVAGNALIAWPIRFGSGGRLLAFDVAQTATPRFQSDVDLSTNGWWNFSSPQAGSGVVFISHDLADYFSIPMPLVPGTASAGGDPGVAGDSKTNYFNYWVQRSFLDVIDYADPLLPTIRKPVNIPGRLEGISHAGALLYTVGQHAATNSPADYRQWLDVSAYDEVSASLVTSLALPQEYPSPHLVIGTNIFLGRPGSTNLPNLVERWALDELTGKLALLGQTKLPAPTQTMAAVQGLLALQTSDEINLVEPSTLKNVVAGKVWACLWMDLQKADAAPDRGLWIPMGNYGVRVIGASSGQH